MLDHCKKNEIHDGEESAHLFIRVSIFNTEPIINNVEIKYELINFVDLIIWTFLECIQIEYLSKDSPFISICRGFS